MARQRSFLPPLGVFVVFEAAGRLESFARAAEELGVTQPAVSKRIRGLEHHLGARLFERTGRATVLTADGRRLFDRTAAALDYLDEACRAMLHPAPQRPLCIAALTAVAHVWLNPVLGELHPEMPSVPLRIVASDNRKDLEAEDVDLAVFLARGDRIGWLLHPLFDEEVMPVANPDYVARHGLDLTLDIAEQARTASGLTLLNHEQIDPERINWNIWARRFAPDLLERNQIKEFNSFALAVSSALAGDGVVVGSAPLMRRLIDAGQLVPLTRDRWAPGTAYCLAHRESRRPGGAARKMMEYLSRQADSGASNP
jgi:LysR family glycine cleavage system transcriptional activator